MVELFIRLFSALSPGLGGPQILRVTDGTHVTDGTAPPALASTGPRWGCIALIALVTLLVMCCGGWGVRERYMVVPVPVEAPVPEPVLPPPVVPPVVPEPPVAPPVPPTD